MFPLPRSCTAFLNIRYYFPLRIYFRPVKLRFRSKTLITARNLRVYIYIYAYENSFLTWISYSRNIYNCYYNWNYRKTHWNLSMKKDENFISLKNYYLRHKLRKCCICKMRRVSTVRVKVKTLDWNNRSLLISPSAFLFEINREQCQRFS